MLKESMLKALHFGLVIQDAFLKVVYSVHTRLESKVFSLESTKQLLCQKKIELEKKCWSKKIAGPKILVLKNFRP